MKPLLLALGMAAGLATGADSFYKEPPLFSTAPSETVSLQAIDRFGPVGIGIELHQPAFVMKVKNVEEGSPAAATGKLNKGQSSKRSTGGNSRTSPRASNSATSSPRPRPPTAWSSWSSGMRWRSRPGKSSSTSPRSAQHQQRNSPGDPNPS